MNKKQLASLVKRTYKKDAIMWAIGDLSLHDESFVQTTDFVYIEKKFFNSLISNSMSLDGFNIEPDKYLEARYIDIDITDELLRTKHLYAILKNSVDLYEVPTSFHEIEKGNKIYVIDGCLIGRFCIYQINNPIDLREVVRFKISLKYHY